MHNPKKCVYIFSMYTSRVCGNLQIINFKNEHILLLQVSTEPEIYVFTCKLLYQTDTSLEHDFLNSEKILVNHTFSHPLPETR